MTRVLDLQHPQPIISYFMVQVVKHKIYWASYAKAKHILLPSKVPLGEGVCKSTGGVRAYVFGKAASELALD